MYRGSPSHRPQFAPASPICPVPGGTDCPPGTAAVEGDCDDSDGWANPDAPEMCDGVDNNCNGEIDEGCAESEESDDDLSGDDGDDKSDGCGCVTTAEPGLAWLWLPLVALVRRRR